MIRKENRERGDFLWDMMQNEAREFDRQKYEGSREEVYERLKGFINLGGGGDKEEDDGKKAYACIMHLERKSN